jgi:hypothetical protein
MANPDRQGQSDYRRTEQEVANSGFDETFKVPATELLAYNSGTDTLDRVQINSSGEILTNAALSGSGGDGAILDGVSSSIKASVLDYTNSNPLAVRLSDTNGDYIAAGAGTQYTEDAAAAANPIGGALNLIRDDARAGSLTTTDGDNVAARGTNAGELYVKHVDAIPVTDNSGSLTVDGSVTVTQGTATNLKSQAEAYQGGSAVGSSNPLQVTLANGTVPSHAVTNAGTFAVQATVASGATNIAKAEDVASADADVGVPAMAIRKGTPANTSGTDGDYEMLQMSAGRLWVDASGKTLTVDGSGVTQPVSGTVTANVGTTNGLALDATLTGGTQQTKLTDGSNAVGVLKSDGTTGSQNAVMTSGSFLSVAFTTSTVQAVGSTDAGNYRWVSVHITSQGGSSTVTFQTSNDNSNWVSTALNFSTSVATLPATSTTSSGVVFQGPLQGRYFRLNVTGIASGTTAGTIVFSALPTAMNVVGGQVTQSGTWTTGSNSATGSAVPANAFYKGLLAQTANPSAASAGNLVGALADKLGKQVVVGSIRDLKVNQITTITTSTSETTVLTAVASTFLDVYGVIVTNTSATAVTVAFKDSTGGTTQFNIAVPAGETRGFMLPESAAIKQGTVNNNWTATTQSVTSVIITMLAVKNI